MHVLKQLKIDDGHLFPATVSIKSSIYVDDTFFGNDDIHELRETRNRLNEKGRISIAESGPRIRRNF